MIYFIQGATTRLIKIGKAVDCQRRLRKLQTGSPDKLHLLKEFYTDDESTELLLHNRFYFCRRHGEWFYPKTLLLEVISEISLSMSTPDVSLLLDSKRLYEGKLTVNRELRRRDQIGPGTGLSSATYVSRGINDDCPKISLVETKMESEPRLTRFGERTPSRCSPRQRKEAEKSLRRECPYLFKEVV